MSNKIKTHAIRQYLIRVKDKDPKMVTNTEWNNAREKINEVINNPDKIVHNKKELPQIHIIGKVAVPVGVRGEKQGKYKPYDSTDQTLYAPTVYCTETFTGGKHDETQKQGA